MAKKRRSKQDKIREKSDEIFIGRKEPILLFEQHLKSTPDDAGFIDILNISGDGGLGKTYLSKKLKGMADAHKKVLTAYTDEGVKSVLDWMHEVSEQFAKKDAPLKSFSDHYEKYLKEKQLLEADEKAPKGWASFLGKTLVKGGLQLTKGVPVIEGIAEMIDKDAAGEQGGEIADYFYRRIKGKKTDEVKLIMSPLLELTPKFLEDLWDYEDDGHHLCLFIDTYEETSPFLDEWLRELMDGTYGDIPLNLTLVIAGRNKLDTNLWSGYLNMVKNFSLSPFTNEESRAYLKERGITNPAVIETILEISENWPIILAMLADEAPTSPESVKDHSADAVTRFLKWIKDPTERNLALHAAIPRQLNLDIARTLLPENADAQALFDWLCKRSFVQVRGGHWAYHPVVRKLMLRYQYKLSQEDWEKLHFKVAEYYEQRASSLGIEDPEKQIKEATWRSYWLEKCYHRLSAAPQKEIGDIVSNLISICFTTKFENFLIWAETISQAEEIHTQSKWGALFRDIYTFGVNRNLTELLPLVQKLNQTSFVKKKNDVIFLHFIEAAITKVLGNEKDAVSSLRCAINKTQPDTSADWFLIGTFFYFIECFDEAIEQFRKAIELNPDFVPAYFSLGDALMDQEKVDEAIEQFRKAIKLEPDAAPAYLRLGDALMDQEKVDEAIEQFRKAIKLEPDAAPAYLRLGDALMEQEKVDEAVENFRKTIEIKHDYHYAYDSLGDALTKQGKLDEAIKNYRKAIEIKHDYAPSYKGLGHALFQLSKIDESIQAFEDENKFRGPDDFSPRINIAFLKLRQGKTEESKQLSESIWEDSHKKEPFTAKNLGHYHLIQNEPEKALEWYRISQPLWEDEDDDLFHHLDSDYDNLLMSSHGITRSQYDAIIQQLKSETK
jgi:tetratricopeptide (TPR) repeat protein